MKSTINVVTTVISILVVVNALSDEEQWHSFKITHGKIYKNRQYDTFRFKIFQLNLREIEEHNKRYQKGLETFTKTVTQFADLTKKEIENLYSLPHFDPIEPYKTFKAKPNVKGASAVDWREKGAVLDVEVQGQCGSCWAFSAKGSIEGQNAIKHNKTIALSPQEILDCSISYGSRGCRGGWMYHAYNYIKDSGISSLDDYKYEQMVGKCRNDTARVDLQLTGYTLVDTNEEALRQAVETIGPVSITFYHGGMTFYEKGIVDFVRCPKDKPTHAVLAVGYGTENGVDYWIMKNSWGTKWGEKGYFRIVRNKNNTCGICSHPMYPNLK